MSITFIERVSIMPPTITLEMQTERNRKRAADEAKIAAKSRKAQMQIEVHTFGPVPFASLSITNDTAVAQNNEHVYVYLSEADLKAMQFALFEARVKIRDASVRSDLTNPQPF